jgi:restriction system protein
MAQVVPPTEFEKSDYPKHPGSQRFGKMIRFATIGPVKAGWLIKEKGRWYLSDDGKKAYTRYQDPEEFNREAGRLYHQWADKQPKEPAESLCFLQRIRRGCRVFQSLLISNGLE